MSYRSRNRIGGQFAPRLIEMLESPAYGVLSRAAHQVLARIEIELAHHGGMDNGKLPVTHVQFIEYGLHRRMIAPAIRELVALGFIEVTEKGHGGNAEFRCPSKYRITYRNADRAPPTHDWRRITEEEAIMIAKGARRLGSNSAHMSAGNGAKKPAQKNRKPPPQSVQSPPPQSVGENELFPPPQSVPTVPPPQSGGTIYTLGVVVGDVVDDLPRVPSPQPAALFPPPKPDPWDAVGDIPECLRRYLTAPRRLKTNEPPEKCNEISTAAGVAGVIAAKDVISA